MENSTGATATNTMWIHALFDENQNTTSCVFPLTLKKKIYKKFSRVNLTRCSTEYVIH